MTHIAILQLPEQVFPGQYLLGMLAEVWRAKGLQVETTSDPANVAHADLAINHVDLTVTPPVYIDALNGCPAVLNGRVRDISKRRVSRNLLADPSDGDGSVVVKTDCNGKGDIERRRRRASGPSAWLRANFEKRFLPWYKSGFLGPEGYRIFGSPDDVPAEVWANPWFVVERFRPESRDGMYVLRVWAFLGDRNTHYEFLGSAPIIKAKNIVGVNPLGEVPEELQEIRRELGFDYGKFDYVVVDGEVILLDANRTPTALTAIMRAGAPNLADGIDRFLRRQPDSDSGDRAFD